MGPRKALPCGACSKSIPKSVFRVQCGACRNWHHPDCAKLSELEIRLMGEQNRTWICNKCRRQSLPFVDNGPDDRVESVSAQHQRGKLTPGGERSDVDSLRSLILELKAEIGGLKNEVSDMNHSLEFLNSMYEEQRRTNKVMGEMMDEVKKENSVLRADLASLQSKISQIDTAADESGFNEIQERQRRSTNILLFNLPEKGSDLADVQGIIHDMAILDSPTISKVLRTGKQNKNGWRSLKVVLSTPQEVGLILKNRAKLKGTNVYVSADLTTRQRELERTVKDELEDRRSKGETNLQIRYSNGIPTIVSKN